MDKPVAVVEALPQPPVECGIRAAVGP